MILKLGGGSGGTIEISDAPKITFSGTWIKWHLEFYGDVLYWEAWFLSSGTLTVEDGYSYTADAWGIGGGGATKWSTAASTNYGGTGGDAAKASGIELSGDVAVTIGAGASYSSSSVQAGGTTKLGSALSCSGGSAPSSSSASGSSGRYRFMDADHADEKGADRTNTINSAKEKSAGGWLPLKRGSGGCEGDGFGGSGGVFGHAGQGALVVRIPA